MYKFNEIGLIVCPGGTTIPPTNNGTDAWAAYQEFLDAGGVTAPYVAPPAPPEQFSKLDIREAMERLGIDAQLDALLDASPKFRTHWDDAQVILLTDPVTQQALASASIDVDTVIAEIHKGE